MPKTHEMIERRDGKEFFGVSNPHEPDEDEKRDAAEERRRRAGIWRCACGYPDMPGTCPGPRNCPMVGIDDHDDAPQGAQMNILIYDIEIEKGVPKKNEDRLADYEYCEGWHDHANMGVSVIGAYEYWTERYRVFCKDNMHEFAESVDTADVIVGFNNIGFDNPVIAACWGPQVELPENWQAKSYDLLQQIWFAAGLGSTFVYPTHLGYGLDAICEKNFQINKTGNGAMAPIYWQRGAIGNVIDYCLNGVRLTKRLMDHVLSGQAIISPVDGRALVLVCPSGRKVAT